MLPALHHTNPPGLRLFEVDLHVDAVDSVFVGGEEKRLFLFYFLHERELFGAIRGFGLEVLVDSDLFFQMSGLKNIEGVFDFLNEKERLHDHLRCDINFCAFGQSFQGVVELQVGLFGKIIHL